MRRTPGHNAAAPQPLFRARFATAYRCCAGIVSSLPCNARLWRIDQHRNNSSSSRLVASDFVFGKYCQPDKSFRVGNYLQSGGCDKHGFSGTIATLVRFLRSRAR